MTNNSSLNQEEFYKYRDAVGQLSNLKTIPLVISEQAAFFIIAQLQLAFRHPNNIGASRDVVRESIQPIVDYFVGDIREILERGFHPEFDVKVDNLPQPDPAWDYYGIWEALHNIKNKIDTALKFIAGEELADDSTDEKLLKILEPASDELVTLIHNELINYVEFPIKDEEVYE
ncbi:MAG: hypothetical protein RMX65_022805 [Nostoc sp. DedQUE01]|nr:hypothetical protein [Nostoc sp. DedQUE01]MDZ8083419.1 hypothetical protein [Nostoc sp. DcaGUA01]